MKVRYATWAMAVTLLACGGEQTGNGTPAAEAEQTAPLADTQTQDPGQLACEPQRDPANRASPYDSTRFALDGGEVLVCYGRPSARGRTGRGWSAPDWTASPHRWRMARSWRGIR